MRLFRQWLADSVNAAGGLATYPTSAADVASWLGKTPTNVYLLQDPSGGAADATGTLNLTELVGAPTYQVATTLPDSRKAIRFADNSPNGLQVDTITRWDTNGATGQSQRWVYVAKFTSPASGTRALISDRNATPFKGWELYFGTTGVYQLRANDGTNKDSIGAIDHSGQWHWGMVFFDAATDLAGWRTNLETGSTIAYTTDFSGDNRRWSLGSGRLNALALDVAYLLHFDGANAESWGATEIAALSAMLPLS